MSYRSILFLTFALTIALPTSAHAATCPLSTQQAYKDPVDSAVYYVTEDCTKRAFRQAPSFFSYFSSWDDVTIVSVRQLISVPADTLGFMPAGPRYQPRSGTLMKSVDDPSVYLVADGGKWTIPSAEIFEAAGFQWGWIEDVDRRVLEQLTTRGEIGASYGYPNGVMVKAAGEPAVYQVRYLESTGEIPQLAQVPSFDVLQAQDYRIDRIIELPRETLSGYPTNRWTQQYGSNKETFLETYAAHWEEIDLSTAGLQVSVPYGFFTETGDREDTPQSLFDIGAMPWDVEFFKFKYENGELAGPEATIRIEVWPNTENKNIARLRRDLNEHSHRDVFDTVRIDGTTWVTDIGNSTQELLFHRWFSTVTEEYQYNIEITYANYGGDDLQQRLEAEGYDDIAEILSRDIPLLDLVDILTDEQLDIIERVSDGLDKEDQDEFNDFITRFARELEVGFTVNE